jgi:hypothetical protein
MRTVGLAAANERRPGVLAWDVRTEVPEPGIR